MHAEREEALARFIERWRHGMTVIGGVVGGALTMSIVDEDLHASRLRLRLFAFGFCVAAVILAAAFALLLAILETRRERRAELTTLPRATALPSAPPPATPAIVPITTTAPPAVSATALTAEPSFLGDSGRPPRRDPG